MATDIDALRDELINDRYSTMSDEEAADDLNSLTTGRTRNRTSMTSSEVFNAIVVSELIALTDGDRATVMAIMGFGSINPFGREADVFINIFGGGSDTITALAAARVVAISRADELSLGKVKAGNVEEARR